MKNGFHEKRALVIGGTGSIGRGISALLAAEGAVVRAVGRHSLPDIDSVVLDLDNPENRSIVIDEACEADILCVVWGPFLQKPLHETTREDWERMTIDNLAFPGMLVSSALPHMRVEGWGRILLVGGTRTDSIRGFTSNAAYAAAKTGLASLVKSVALGYANQGISCNAICPGFVDTEYLESGVKEVLAAKNPDGKLISAGEIAELALFLLKNSLFNGAIIPADKGWSPVFI